MTHSTPRFWNRLWVRLSIYFSSFALLSALLLTIAARLLVTDTVRQSILPEELQAPGGIVDTLGNYYEMQGSWEGVEEIMRGAQATFRLWSRRLVLAIVDVDDNPVYVSTPRPGRADTTTNATADNNSQNSDLMAGHRAPIRLPIEGDGTIVGYLLVRVRSPIPSETISSDLFQRLSRYLVFIAIGGGLLGIVLGVVASRTLTAPLTELATAARAIGAGNLHQRVPPSGSEEIAAVAAAFNEMAIQLEEAETLRRDLMADVAHELRTPLSVIQGNLRAILDDVYILDKAEVTKLYTQTRLLSRLVNDLHELAQAEAGQLPLNRVPTNLQLLFTESIDLFQPMAEEIGITLQLQITSMLPTLPVDAARLRQVLHNLLANALRHTPAGGTVTLQTSTDAEQIIIAIRDSGDGIMPEHLPHIFDRFYRTDRARSRDTGGTGLGLAIVRAIVQVHGGEVHAQSEGIGKGSTFTVTLPIAEELPNIKSRFAPALQTQ